LRAEGGEQSADGAQIAGARKDRLDGRCGEPRFRTLVRDPVDEEDDVARLFREHVLEDLEERFVEKPDRFRETEDAETEERIDAFFVAERDERMLRRLNADGGRDLDAEPVPIEHRRKQLAVPRLLDALHRHRFPDLRIDAAIRKSGDHDARVTFGHQRRAPKGNGTQATDCEVIELRPREIDRVERPMRIDERTTEKELVFFRADHTAKCGEPRDDSSALRGHLCVPAARVATPPRDRAEASTIAVAIAATLVAALHLAIGGRYGFQRDELYFIVCARHLAWGYVDQPPLIAVLTHVATTLFGDSLLGLRIFPAMAAAATVALCGVVARRFGGGLLAQLLAMVAVALAPFYLAVGSLMTMNAFEPLLWMSAIYAFVRARDRSDLRWWTILGVILGLGFLNKYTMFFFAASAAIAIAATSARGVFARRGLWLAVAIAVVMAAPNLLWQGAHGWPQIAVLRNAAAEKNVVVGPLNFYLQQILMMNPLAAPLWIAGLWSFAFSRGTERFRWIALSYVVLSAVYLRLGAKVYYLAPIYPVFLAAGGVLVERRLAPHARRVAPAYAVLLFLLGAVIAPQAAPVLPLAQFLAYQRVFNLRQIKFERHPQGLVPQNFADQMGWRSLVAQLDVVYERLPPERRVRTTIFTGNYGQAAAVDVLGAAAGLPRAVSGHNEYFLFGPRGYDGSSVIAVGLDRAKLSSEWASVVRVGTYRDAYVLPDQSNLPIYLCTRPREPFARWWPHAERYV